MFFDTTFTNQKHSILLNNNNDDINNAIDTTYYAFEEKPPLAINNPNILLAINRN